MDLETAEQALQWLIDNELISLVVTEDDTADRVVCSQAFQVVRNGEQLDVWATLSFDDLCESFEKLARKK
jgi:UTP:GlnB (protein PII) uridylyltransferase